MKVSNSSITEQYIAVVFPVLSESALFRVKIPLLLYCFDPNKTILGVRILKFNVNVNRRNQLVFRWWYGVVYFCRKILYIKNILNSKLQNK